jgi:hypothetical protein
MKTLYILIAALVSSLFSPLIAQAQTPATPSACGDLRVSMAVDLDNSHHDIAKPDPGKATIYFIQDTGTFLKTPAYPTSKIGIDGNWVGANKKDSYFSVSVDPGEHHLCAAVQSSFVHEKTAALAHFTAEAGKVYFYRTKMFFADTNLEYFDLNPVDQDEAAYLISFYPQAKAQTRK